MSRADATYSTRQRSRIRRNDPTAVRAKVRKRIVPRWVPILAACSLVVMIIVTINFRAFSELKQEEQHNIDLNNQVQEMTTENLTLQEEIHYLKNDSGTIEREAKKFGLTRPKGAKSPVPAK